MFLEGRSWRRLEYPYCTHTDVFLSEKAENLVTTDPEEHSHATAKYFKRLQVTMRKWKILGFSIEYDPIYHLHII